MMWEDACVDQASCNAGPCPCYTNEIEAKDCWHLCYREAFNTPLKTSWPQSIDEVSVNWSECDSKKSSDIEQSADTLYQ